MKGRLQRRSMRRGKEGRKAKEGKVDETLSLRTFPSFSACIANKTHTISKIIIYLYSINFEAIRGREEEREVPESKSMPMGMEFLSSDIVIRWLSPPRGGANAKGLS